jgi:hypothetical protein
MRAEPKELKVLTREVVRTNIAICPPAEGWLLTQHQDRQDAAALNAPR